MWVCVIPTASTGFAQQVGAKDHIVRAAMLREVARVLGRIAQQLRCITDTEERIASGFAIRTIHARPSPRFFGRRRGITWLNMLNDQAAGLAAKLVSGTPRDSLHIDDVLQSQRGGRIPESVGTDTGSYSDIVFGLLHLAGYQYQPQLANLPDQRLWRFDTRADYGPLDQAPRGRIDVDKIGLHWEDMCRVAVSIHSGEVSGHDITPVISRADQTRWGRRSPITGGFSKPWTSCPVREEDAARLSAFIRAHIGLDGHYAFHLPDLGGTRRSLRDPDTRGND